MRRFPASPSRRCGERGAAQEAQHGLPPALVLGPLDGRLFLALEDADDEHRARHDEGSEVGVLGDEERSGARGDLVGDEDLRPRSSLGLTHATEKKRNHAEGDESTEKRHGDHEERGDVLVFEDSHRVVGRWRRGRGMEATEEGRESFLGEETGGWSGCASRDFATAVDLICARKDGCGCVGERWGRERVSAREKRETQSRQLHDTRAIILGKANINSGTAPSNRTIAFCRQPPSTTKWCVTSCRPPHLLVRRKQNENDTCGRRGGGHPSSDEKVDTVVRFTSHAPVRTLARQSEHPKEAHFDAAARASVCGVFLPVRATPDRTDKTIRHIRSVRAEAFIFIRGRIYLVIYLPGTITWYG